MKFSSIVNIFQPDLIVRYIVSLLIHHFNIIKKIINI